MIQMILIFPSIHRFANVEEQLSFGRADLKEVPCSGEKFLSMVLLAGMLISQSVPRVLAATYCDQAQFVSDLTVPDGSSFAPGAAFTKTWRLMNIGTCTWNTSYSVVWSGGDSVSAPASVKLPVDVLPGQMLDISVNLTAPTTAGHYKALFKLSNPSGVQFGIGESASDPFWVDINVVQTNTVIYDFVANAPYAQWKSGAGIIPFPGTSGDSRGFGYQVNNPHLEDDSLDSSPGLLVVPQNKFNGYIQATYPEFQVQQGDRLQTLGQLRVWRHELLRHVPHRLPAPQRSPENVVVVEGSIRQTLLSCQY